MAASEHKLKLGQNHRRAVSVLLRGLEQMCDEIESWLEEKPGVLRQLDDDLSPDDRERLRQMTCEILGEIRRLAGEIELDCSIKSPRRAILALLSASIVNLEESSSSRLRGYGTLSREAGEKLDSEFERLLERLEQMFSVLAAG